MLTLLAALLSAPIPMEEDSAGRPVLRLWESGAPGYEELRDLPERSEGWWVDTIHHPSLTVYRPVGDVVGSNSGGGRVGVVVVPGGGLSKLVIGAEGNEAAQFLNSLGVTAFVLKHRLPRQEGAPYDLDSHPKEDGQRALRLVRHRAAEFGVDPERIGMLGFSAGGEVVSWTAYTAGDVVTRTGPDGPIEDRDAVDAVSSRPDFQMLVYPGPLGVPETIPAGSPPAFLLIADQDFHLKTTVALYLKLHEAQVPAELHVFAAGKHGFNMGQRSDKVTIRDWPQRMRQWMQDHVFEEKAE